MCLWQVSLAGDSGSLIGHLSVTFGGAPTFDVADVAWTVPIWDCSKGADYTSWSIYSIADF